MHYLGKTSYAIDNATDKLTLARYYKSTINSDVSECKPREMFWLVKRLRFKKLFIAY